MAIVKWPARPRPAAAAPADDDDDTDTSSGSDGDGAASPQSLGDPIDGRYQRLAGIGSGAFGHVYRAVDNRTGEIVAVKCLWKEHDNPEGIVLNWDLADEVNALEACRGHPHIVQMIDHGRRRDGAAAGTRPDAYIVMELVGPSLEHTICQRGKDAGARRYPESEVRHLMRQLLSGVGRMHELGLMHRDLKPSNVLVDGRGGLKVCDLGLAFTKEEAAPPYSNPIGSLPYNAPELLLGSSRYDEMIDMWALGCMMAQLLAGEQLFHGMSDEDMLVRIVDVLGMDDIAGWSGYDDSMIPKTLQSGRRRSRVLQMFPFLGLPKPLKSGLRHSRLRRMFALPGMAGGAGLPELSEAGFEVLSGLLTCNPEKRMTAAQALQHRWFPV
uniref:[RNA-polymerase]-subunit kinase n=1 Tax=Oryza punctata TaxID=4537 RepID=A0A0E0MLV7_ORYPU